MTDEATTRFAGAAKRLEDIDLPRIGADIGVGEDVVHMLLEVESLGDGFDRLGRPKMLFEPHVFDRNLKGQERERARKTGLAYPKWRRNYPADSYPKLLAAIQVNETAALRAASWGGSQILGENHLKAGYDTPQDMVEAFMDDEDNHVEAMISFVKRSGLADDLQRIDRKLRAGQKITPADCAPIARTYNGESYAEHNYHGRLAASANKWHRIPDTPFDVQDFKDAALAESVKAGFDGRTGVQEPEPHDKGVTTGAAESGAGETAGTSPPAPAIEVKPAQVPLLTRVTSLSIPTGVGAVVLAVGKWVGGLPPFAWFALAGVVVAAMIIGYLVWRDSRADANDRTKILFTAAADPERNNLRSVDNFKPV